MRIILSIKGMSSRLRARVQERINEQLERFGRQLQNVRFRVESVHGRTAAPLSRLSVRGCWYQRMVVTSEHDHRRCPASSLSAMRRKLADHASGIAAYPQAGS